MDKREMIKRVLGEYLERAMDAGDETHGQVHRFLNRNYHMSQIIDALAEQAIVEKGTWYPEGRFVKDGAIYNWYKNPIRCTAIILPVPPEEGSLEEEDGDKG